MCVCYIQVKTKWTCLSVGFFVLVSYNKKWIFTNETPEWTARPEQSELKIEEKIEELPHGLDSNYEFKKRSFKKNKDLRALQSLTIWE